MKQALGGGEGTFAQFWMGGGGTTAQDKAKLHLTDKGEENTIYSANNFLAAERIGRRRRDAFGRRFVHVDNLHQLQRFWEMRRFYFSIRFMRSRLPFPVKLGVNNLLDEKITKAKVLMDNISNQLTEFVRKVAKRKRGNVWRRLSIISPRLFSVALSSTRDESASKKDLTDSLLLSPRLFSLSPNDGLFALPDIFNNQRVLGEQRWMNAILALSGAGKAIRKALDRLEGEKKQLEDKVFPTVLDLERRDKRWRDLLDEEQKRSMEQRGFAFLTREQAKLVYGSAEKAIRALANLDEQISDGGLNNSKRERRQIEQGKAETEGEKHLKVLAPYAFANSVADGVALEAIILSPSAFVAELLSPAALSTEVLSPRAFIAAILSPEALFARVLSPSTFHADILSPSALTPFILSPEAMFAEILSPRALEPRILSPELGMIKVLSPAVEAARWKNRSMKIISMDMEKVISMDMEKVINMDMEKVISMDMEKVISMDMEKLKHGGKKQLRASFRIQRKQNTPECDCVGGTDCQKGCTKPSYNHYKSPYSVFTEPKISRPTRSCPAGPTNNQEKQQTRNFNKFSPPLEIQATIHERSGSYENFSTAQLEQLSEDKQRESGEGSESWKKAVDQNPAERPQKQAQRQQTEQKRRRDITLTEEIGKRIKRCQNRCGRHSITQYCHQQQPLSTSEYWSADPSPISENQPYFHHFRISPRVPPDVGEDEESSSAWECQVRILTQELRACKGVAEKYRSKYLRLKARTEELNSELIREKERNSWLLNQLIATNDMMTQLSWAHLHFRDTQKHNFLNGADVADNEMRPPPPNYPFGALLEDFEQPEKCERDARHRSAAGEVQAELSSDEFDDRATAIRKGLWAVEPASLGGVGQRVESENGQQTINSKCKQQLPLRTPTPILVESANEVGAPGTPFLNFNIFQHAQHIRNQLHVEVARGSHLNSSRNSNSRLISPPFRTGVKKMVDNNSSEMIEDDNDEQFEEDEEDSESFIGTDPEEQDQQLVVIPLDAFCQQQQLGEEKGDKRARGKKETRKLRGDQTLSLKLLLRHSRSSEDLRSTGKEFFGSERVLFRPSRKSLLSGAIGNGKGPRIFRRFGQREREALAKFDYLLDERTDLSGLMSSPEKLAETKTD
uniref:ANK_REP_REGION domain-containing protein n=1 Tax=Globodera pallida TaxID=36090 RepID=A0A183BME1_GLOPA